MLELIWKLHRMPMKIFQKISDETAGRIKRTDYVRKVYGLFLYELK